MAKVLIIEDDLRLARMYQKIIAFAGHAVDVATNGIEGLEKAKSGNPNLILIDVMLPGMSGIEVLEKLRGDPKTKKTPVVMVTNLADEKYQQEALKLGIRKYIFKGDTDPQQVADLVKEVVGNPATDKQKKPGT